MKKFIRQIFLFSLPCILIACLLIYVDFFKVFKDYESYTETSLIFLNREFTSLKSLQKMDDVHKPNAFIFGSSRSQAFKCKDWEGYLNSEARPFHFDASNEALIGVVQKLRYLEEHDYEIENVILVVDIHLLSQTSDANRNAHINVSHYDLSKKSKWTFYKPFLIASFNPKFLLAYLDYAIFKKYRNYMSAFITPLESPNTTNPENMDIYYGWDAEIEEDSIGYYDKRIAEGEFYDRSKKKHFYANEYKHSTTILLTEIANIFERNQTNYKIVVSPNYDQVPLPTKFDIDLKRLFDEDQVFNYSGVNEYTESIGNFYESSHYRPFIARKILREIYSE